MATWIGEIVIADLIEVSNSEHQFDNEVVSAFLFLYFSTTIVPTYGTKLDIKGPLKH